jgi:sulfate adenylyltransferase subunit 2
MMLVAETLSPTLPPTSSSAPHRLSQRRLLEAESIHRLREVASEFERPVMLYSIGKDSSVIWAIGPAPILTAGPG